MSQTPSSIIWNQINTMDKMAVWDWGVMKHQPVSANKGLTLQLRSTGRVKWKGYIWITYNEGTDLYDVKFFRIRKYEKKVDWSVEGVYLDNLISIIDAKVLGRKS